jgi:hypothetical protein
MKPEMKKGRSEIQEIISDYFENMYSNELENIEETE